LAIPCLSAAHRNHRTPKRPDKPTSQYPHQQVQKDGDFLLEHPRAAAEAAAAITIFFSLRLIAVCRSFYEQVRHH
jgi:hypothetical protein